MLTLAFSAKVAASPRRIWRVLMEPAASAHWLPGHQQWIDPPPLAFSPSMPLRFRSRLRGIHRRGELQLVECRPGRARVRIRLGLLAFDVRFTLGPEPGVPGAARIGFLLSLGNEVAIVGGSLDRFEARKLASTLAEQTLSALAAYAEERERCARLALSGA